MLCRDADSVKYLKAVARPSYRISPGAPTCSLRAPRKDVSHHVSVDTPPVRYAQRQDRALAYQIQGSGNVDVLVLSEWPANSDSVWEHPLHLRMWRLLGSLGRAIRFDRSGIGSSDPHPDGMVDPAAWAEDALAVMDEVSAEGSPSSPRVGAPMPR